MPLSPDHLFPALHPHEYSFSLKVLRSLLRSQCPQYASLQLTPLCPGGTDHFMIRLGDGYVARLPRYPGVQEAAEVERLWLPLIALHTSRPVPVPLFKGQPGCGYPANWSIVPWIEGQPSNELLRDAKYGSEPAHGLAFELGSYLKSLREIPVPLTTRLPPFPKHYRTQALHARKIVFQEALSQCEDVFDSQQLFRIWTNHLDSIGADDGLKLKFFAHTDLQPSNIIISSSMSGQTPRLMGIIDWSGLSVGDPAIDLLPAWSLFDQDTRRTFLEAAEPDNKMRLRGRAWALSIGIIAYPYYRYSRPDHAAMSKRQVEEVIKDVEGTL